MTSIAGGVGGATALTLVHETVRRVRDDAPRADLLARQAIARGVKAAGGRKPSQSTLYRAAMAGDLVSNSAYYSLVGRSFTRAALLGTAAGAGALLLPQRFGMDAKAVRRTKATAAMTFAWYLGAAFVAALIARMLSRGKEERSVAG